jgi:hypothetical protein
MAFDVPGALGAGYSSAEIIDYLKANPAEAGDFKVDEALKAGYTPDEIVDHLNPKSDRINVQGIPVLAPLDRGIAHLREQGANLAQDLGATGIASGIRQSIPQATLHAKTAGQSVSEDLGNHRYLSAISNLPSAAIEQAAPLAGALVAGAATGGSVPAVLGTGAAIGALTQGDEIARARATNNGRTDGPTATDMALGLTGALRRALWAPWASVAWRAKRGSGRPSARPSPTVLRTRPSPRWRPSPGPLGPMRATRTPQAPTWRLRPSRGSPHAAHWLPLRRPDRPLN